MLPAIFNYTPFSFLFCPFFRVQFSLVSVNSFYSSCSIINVISLASMLWMKHSITIVISRMTSFVRMSQKLVFHQSKCICTIKRILSTTAMYVSSSSFMYLRISCYCDGCLNSSDLRAGVTTLLNTIQFSFVYFQTVPHKYSQIVQLWTCRSLRHAIFGLSSRFCEFEKVYSIRHFFITISQRIPFFQD